METYMKLGEGYCPSCFGPLIGGVCKRCTEKAAKSLAKALEEARSPQVRAKRAASEKTKDLEGILEDSWLAGYREGKADGIDRIIQSGLLEINRGALEEAIMDPCMDCPDSTHELIIGCQGCGPRKCAKKQRQFLALKVKEIIG